MPHWEGANMGQPEEFQVNEEGRADRDYFSDWGKCICTEGEADEFCPLYDDHAEEMEDEDE